MNPGDAVPALERTISFDDVVAYAGATWDWHRVHYDPAVYAPLPGPLVDGQVFGALIAEQLLDWLGPNAFITNLSFRFKSMVFAGDAVRCEGVVEAIEDGVLSTSHRVMCAQTLAVEGTAKVRLS